MKQQPILQLIDNCTSDTIVFPLYIDFSEYETAGYVLVGPRIGCFMLWNKISQIYIPIKYLILK